MAENSPQLRQHPIPVQIVYWCHHPIFSFFIAAFQKTFTSFHLLCEAHDTLGIPSLACLRYIPNSVGLVTTCRYCYETDELPNPRPTQPKKIFFRLKRAFEPLFPTANNFSFFGLGFDTVWETYYKKPNETLGKQSSTIQQYSNINSGALPTSFVAHGGD